MTTHEKPHEPPPEILRAGISEHAEAAAAETVEPDRAGLVAAQAARLEPLQKIQTALDQLVNHANTHRLGELGPFGHDFLGYAAAEIEGAKKHLETLLVAAAAGESMVGSIEEQLAALQKIKKATRPAAALAAEPHEEKAGKAKHPK